MNIFMVVTLVIYFSFNAFLTGIFVAESREGQKYSLQDKLTIASMVLFGSFVITLVYTYKELKTRVWDEYNLAFWLTIKNEKWNKLSKKALWDINENIKLRRFSKSLSDRLYRKAVGIINKRNNYTFVEETEND